MTHLRSARAHSAAFTLILALLLLLGANASAQNDDAAYEVETLIEGLERPWGMAFLPDSTLILITERPGRLLLVNYEEGSREELEGLPEIDSEGQGGLLDVALHPNFAEEPWVYLSYSASNDEGLTATHIGRGQLDLEGLALDNFEVLLIVEPFREGPQHYGSRLLFDADNRLYISTGDRRDTNFGPEHVSQDTSNLIGTTIRLEADGSIPDDNPFVNDPDVRDEIYSYGHRNVQAMAFEPATGRLWQAEHGENNGDEINLIEAGGNYGWPLATYGVDYRTGETFAPTPLEVPETIPPVYFWLSTHPQGFPPSGFAFYSGDAFPAWQGHAFIGNLASQYLGRFTFVGDTVVQTGRLLEGRGWRIRDVAVNPADGFLYVLVDDEDAPLVRLSPAND